MATKVSHVKTKTQPATTSATANYQGGLIFSNCATFSLAVSANNLTQQVYSFNFDLPVRSTCIAQVIGNMQVNFTTIGFSGATLSAGCGINNLSVPGVNALWTPWNDATFATTAYHANIPYTAMSLPGILDTGTHTAFATFGNGSTNPSDVGTHQAAGALIVMAFAPITDCTTAGGCD